MAPLRFATMSESVYTLMLSWGSYILLLFTYLLLLEYSTFSFINDNSLLYISLLGIPNFLLPIISFFWVIMFRSFEKQKPISARELYGRLR